MENINVKETSLKISKLLFILCALVYGSGYIARGTYSVVVDIMREENIISGAIPGLISGIYFACYAIGQILNGFLADKRNPFYMVLIGILIIIISSCLMFLLPNPSFLLIIWWGLNGIGQSMLWTPIFYIINHQICKEFRFKAITFFTLTTPVGRIAGYLLSGLSLTITNNYWKSVFIMAAMVMVIMCSLWLTIHYFIKDKIVDEKNKVENKKTREGSLWKIAISSGLILTIPAMLVHGLFLNGAVEWVPSIVQNMFGVREDIASYLMIIIPLFGIVGVLACNTFYKKVFKENEVLSGLFFMITSLIFMIALFLISKSGNASILMCVLFVGIFGLVYMSQVAFNHLSVGLFSMHFVSFGLSSTVSGILNGINYGGAAISTYGLSYLVDNINLLFIIWISSLLVAIISLFITNFRWKKFIDGHSII